MILLLTCFINEEYPTMKTTLLALSCLLLSNLAYSATDVTDKSISQPIKSSLARLGLTPTEVNPSKVDGLLEVMTERGLFYISEDGQFLVHGKMYDLTNGVENVTEQSLAKVRVVDIKKFKDSMISFPAKNEKYKVTVFTDTSCGYCRKLHSQIQQYNDLGITVQYLAFPRSGITGRTFNELTAIWCSADPQRSLTSVKNGSKIDLSKSSKCEAPIAEQYAFGMKVGVSGTPAIIFEDGLMIPGYQDPEQLLSALINKD